MSFSQTSFVNFQNSIENGTRRETWAIESSSILESKFEIKQCSFSIGRKFNVAIKKFANATGFLDYIRCEKLFLIKLFLFYFYECVNFFLLTWIVIKKEHILLHALYVKSDKITRIMYIKNVYFYVCLLYVLLLFHPIAMKLSWVVVRIVSEVLLLEPFKKILS